MVQCVCCSIGRINKAMEFITTSDLTAALVGAGWGEIYGGPGSPAMAAVKSFVISVIARMVSKSPSVTSAIPSLTGSQKNQLIVGILSGFASYYKKEKLLRGVLSGVSIDLLASELLSLTNTADKAWIGGAAV